MTELQAIQGSIKHWKKNIKLIKNECLDDVEYMGDSCDCCKYNGGTDINNCNNCPAKKYTGKNCCYSGWGAFCWEMRLNKPQITFLLDAANNILSWLKRAETNCRKERKNVDRKKD